MTARTLTDDQRTALTDAITLPGAVEILIDTSQDDAQAFADEFAAVFTGASWNVVQTPLSNAWFATPSGLSFLAQGDLPLSAHQGDVIAGLNAGDTEYHQLDAMLPEGVDVRLLVGRVGV